MLLLAFHCIGLSIRTSSDFSIFNWSSLIDPDSLNDSMLLGFWWEQGKESIPSLPLQSITTKFGSWWIPVPGEDGSWTTCRLVVMNEVLGAPHKTTETEPHGRTRRKWQVMAVFLLHRTEAPSYPPDLLLQDICFLLGGRFRTLLEDCQGLSRPQTTADPCWFWMGTSMYTWEKMYANVHQCTPEKTWTTSSMTNWLLGWWSRAWWSKVESSWSWWWRGRAWGGLGLSCRSTTGCAANISSRVLVSMPMQYLLRIKDC